MLKPYPCFPEINKWEFGEIIRNKRKELNMTQAELSERADISEYYLGEIERGEKLPSITYLRNLCIILDLSIDEMLCLPPQKKNKNKHYYKYNYTPEMHKSQHVTKF